MLIRPILAHKHFFQDLINVKKFSVAKFVNELETRIMQTDPKIYIYVGDKRFNFNRLNQNIEKAASLLDKGTGTGVSLFKEAEYEKNLK